MPRKCCAKLCKNKYVVKSECSFYAFPIDGNAYEEWAIRVGREDILNKYEPGKHYVCSEHFDLSDLHKVGKYLYLKKGALPLNYLKLKVRPTCSTTRRPNLDLGLGLIEEGYICVVDTTSFSECPELIKIVINESTFSEQDFNDEIEHPSKAVTVEVEESKIPIVIKTLSEHPSKAVTVEVEEGKIPFVIQTLSESKYSGETAQKPSKANEHKVETGVVKQGCNGSVLTCEHLIAFIEERAKCYKLERVKEELNTEIECLKEEIEVLKKLKSEVHNIFPDLLQVKIEEVDSGSS